MSSLDIPLIMRGIGRLSESPAPLRIVQCAGETLRLPARCTSVRVLSGTAWISQRGKDVILAAGETQCVCRDRLRAVIGPVGCDAVVLELTAR